MTPPLTNLAPVCDRPEGEPPLWAGVSLLVFVALVGVFAAAAIGG